MIFCHLKFFIHKKIQMRAGNCIVLVRANIYSPRNLLCIIFLQTTIFYIKRLLSVSECVKTIDIRNNKIITFICNFLGFGCFIKGKIYKCIYIEHKRDYPEPLGNSKPINRNGNLRKPVIDSKISSSNLNNANFYFLYKLKTYIYQYFLVLILQFSCVCIFQ